MKTFVILITLQQKNCIIVLQNLKAGLSINNNQIENLTVNVSNSTLSTIEIHNNQKDIKTNVLINLSIINSIYLDNEKNSSYFFLDNVYTLEPININNVDNLSKTITNQSQSDIVVTGT
jgi:hypothetical protein